MWSCFLGYATPLPPLPTKNPGFGPEGEVHYRLSSKLQKPEISCGKKIDILACGDQALLSGLMLHMPGHPSSKFNIHMLVGTLILDILVTSIMDRMTSYSR